MNIPKIPEATKRAQNREGHNVDPSSKETPEGCQSWEGLKKDKNAAISRSTPPHQGVSGAGF